MLEVQRWLEANSFDYNLLEEFYGVESNFHDDGRVILNYGKETPKGLKFHDIVCECRALCLNSKTGELIARAFPRFFNLGERPDQQFNWSRFVCNEKVDGSLILVYHYNNKWHIQTRGGFGDNPTPYGPMNFRELVEPLLPPNWQSTFEVNFAYVFEVCSVYNKVVRHYPTPILYLLSCFLGPIELSHQSVDEIAELLGLRRPELHAFKNENQLIQYLEELERDNKTYEGIVIRDSDDNRIKCKNKGYVALHQLSSNGAIGKDKRLIPYIMKNDTDEICTYYPELKPRIYELTGQYVRLANDTFQLWDEHRNKESQKEFALAVKDHPLGCLLFRARKSNQHPSELLEDFEDKVVEILAND